MADFNLSVVVHLIDYPPRLDGPAGTALDSMLSDVATARLIGEAHGFDDLAIEMHGPRDFEDCITAGLDAVIAAPNAELYRAELVRLNGTVLAAIQAWDFHHPATATPEASHG